MWKTGDVNYCMQALNMGKHGRTWLKMKCPDATQEEIDAVMANAPQLPVPPPAHTNEYKRKFITATWLLGASQTQLGQYLHVTQQTINKHISKELPVHDRNSMRLYPPPMETWKIAALYTEFYDFVRANSEEFVDSNSLEIAHTLDRAQLTNPEDDEVDDYGAAPDRSFAVESDEPSV